MAICPFAVQRILPENGTQSTIDPTASVLHSNAGNSGDLYGWWNTPGQVLESHFQIALDGTIYQYMDTTVRADADMDANGFGIATETANNPGFGSLPAFDLDTWQDAQRASLIRLNVWLCEVHPTIPAAHCTDGVHGIAGHGEFANWTTYGHACPGAARQRQIVTDIIPAVQAGLRNGPAPSAPAPDEGFDMAITQKDLEDTVYRMTRKVLVDLGIDADTANALKAATAALTEAKAANLYGIAANKKLDEAAAAEPPKA